MKELIKKFFYQKKLLLFCLIITVLANKIYSRNIKVLIKKYSYDYFFKNKIKISSNNGFIVSNLKNINQQNKLETNCINISYNKNLNKWFINSKSIKPKEIKIESSDENFLQFDNYEYEGNFILCINEKNDCIYLINELSLENYLIDVLGSETIASWPHESHKVSAVIMRTYALFKILEAIKIERKYDLKATIDDQLYEGHNYNEKIANAIFETNGQIIMYNGLPILSMYHICCGGIIPVKCSGFDFINHPYLARQYACNSCKNSKSYEWKIKFSLNEACQRLSSIYKKNIISIKNIELIHKSRSGSIKKIIFKIIAKNKNGKNYTDLVILKNKDFRKVFSINLSSYSSFFSVNIENNSLFIKGKGRGHLMGLCQSGAKIMIDEGISYNRIIAFYYPDTIIDIYEKNK